MSKSTDFGNENTFYYHGKFVWKINGEGVQIFDKILAKIT